MEKKKIRLKSSMIYGILLYIAGYMVLYVGSNMFSTYLNLSGYTNAQIANILSLVSIANYAVQPVMGQLIDSGRCKLTGYILCASIAFGGTVFFASSPRTFFTAIIYALFVKCCCAGVDFLMDSWVMKLAQLDSELDFPLIRAFGSLSYALSGLVFGKIFSIYSFKASLIGLPLILAFMAVICFLTPEPSLKTKAREKTKIRDHLSILKNPLFDFFLLFQALGMGILLVCDTYIPVLILDMGGTTADSGLATFVLCMTEFICGLFFTRICTKLGTNNTIAIGLCGFAIKLVLISYMPTPKLVVLACLTQAVSYCFFMPGKMQFVQENVQTQDVGTALYLCQLMQSLTAVCIFNPLIGKFSTLYGTAVMMRIFGVSTVVLGIIYAAGIRIIPKLMQGKISR